MTQINKITREEYPVLFADFSEFVIGDTGREHRRGSNYFVSSLLKFDQDNLPEHPELHGLWESDTYVDDYEYGCDSYPDNLYRVEQKTRTISETYYERVKEDTHE